MTMHHKPAIEMSPRSVSSCLFVLVGGRQPLRVGMAQWRKAKRGQLVINLKHSRIIFMRLLTLLGSCNAAE